MKLDRSWIKLGNRSHPEYIRGVKEFLNFAISNSPNESQLRCPCSRCNNCVWRHYNQVQNHIFINGMLKNYTSWVHHGEVDERVDIHSNVDVGGEDMDLEMDDEFDNTIGMLHDMCNGTHVNVMGEDSDEDINSDANPFAKLFMDADQQIYPGSKVSKLSFIIKLLHIKLLNGWSNKSFDMLLEFLNEVMPSDAHVP